MEAGGAHEQDTGMGFGHAGLYYSDLTLLMKTYTRRDLQDAASLTLKFKFNPKLGIDNPVLSLAEDHDPSGNSLTH